MDLSIIVCSYNMRRQITQTVKTLIPPYQEGTRHIEYEIIVVDNGSDDLQVPWIEHPQVKLNSIDRSVASSSPCKALNDAVGISTGEVICMMIDGARMVTPRVIAGAMEHIGDKAIVDVRSYHLGNKSQSRSIHEGYCEEVEIQMLKDAGWPDDKYALFDVSVPAGSNSRVLEGPCSESTCLFMTRKMWNQIGGYNERFVYPGGGMSNMDLFWRAVKASDIIYTPLFEGTFHQVHGGVSTNGGERKGISKEWVKEYEQVTRRNLGIEYTTTFY